MTLTSVQTFFSLSHEIASHSTGKFNGFNLLCTPEVILARCTQKGSLDEIFILERNWLLFSVLFYRLISHLISKCSNMNLVNICVYKHTSTQKKILRKGGGGFTYDQNSGACHPILAGWESKAIFNNVTLFGGKRRSAFMTWIRGFY